MFLKACLNHDHSWPNSNASWLEIRYTTIYDYHRRNYNCRMKYHIIPPFENAFGALTLILINKISFVYAIQIVQ